MTAMKLLVECKELAELEGGSQRFSKRFCFASWATQALNATRSVRGSSTAPHSEQKFIECRSRKSCNEASVSTVKFSSAKGSARHW